MLRDGTQGRKCPGTDAYAKTTELNKGSLNLLLISGTVAYKRFLFASLCGFLSAGIVKAADPIEVGACTGDEHSNTSRL